MLLILPCGYKIDRARQDADAHAQRLEAIAPRAIEQGRAWVLNGSDYFNRSGPRTVDGVEILGTILHPDLAPETDVTGRAEKWEPQAAHRE